MDWDRRRAVRLFGDQIFAGLDRFVILDVPREERRRRGRVENVVVGRDQGSGRAKVVGQRHARAAGLLHQIAGVDVGKNVGPTEPINRLLGVADQIGEVPAATFDKHLVKEEPLKLISILELVDQSEAVTLSHRPDQLLTTRTVECMGDARDQVIEIELAGRGLVTLQDLADNRQAGLDDRGLERDQNRLQTQNRLGDLRRAWFTQNPTTNAIANKANSLLKLRRPAACPRTGPSDG